LWGNAEVTLRVGALVVSVNLIFLAVAFAFFVRLSFQNLYPAVVPKRSRAVVALLAASCLGILGAWLYGLLGLSNSTGSTVMPDSRLEFPFGSFGGYWGVILGSVLTSLLVRGRVLRQADAFVPGILVGGAIARLAGLFNNANPGILIDLGIIPWFQPFKLWALYDIVAHLLTLLIVLRLRRVYGGVAGLPLVSFLTGYGAMRFLIEFVRDSHMVLGTLTYGQIMAIAQVIAGTALLVLRLKHIGIAKTRGQESLR